jgi:hypothetical protein
MTPQRVAGRSAEAAESTEYNSTLVGVANAAGTVCAGEFRVVVPRSVMVAGADAIGLVELSHAGIGDESSLRTNAPASVTAERTSPE